MTGSAGRDLQEHQFGGVTVSQAQNQPPIHEYPGYFTGKPSFFRRHNVHLVGAGLAGLLLGAVFAGGGSTSAATDQPTAGEIQARISDGVDAGLDQAVQTAVDEALDDERARSSDELRALQDQLAEVESQRDRVQRTLARSKKAATVRQRRAVAAAVSRTRAQVQAQYAAAAPRGFSGGGSTTTAATDPRFDWCYEANDAGYGPYRRGVDPEYDWYDDADNDGVVCES